MSREKNISERKATGSHFTPTDLAKFVASRIIRNIDFCSIENLKVLDPACGDGELLVAFIENIPIEYRSKIILIGIESNREALLQARIRLSAFVVNQIILEEADFLDMNERTQTTLFDESLIRNKVSQNVDVIIANPPYVRTQILGAEKSGELAEAFGLKGRVDLYHVFLIAMTQSLVKDGILGVITSNRFLFTRDSATLRYFLAREYEIFELFDLGDTKLFEAAVLPAIFIGKRKQQTLEVNESKNRKVHFVRIYETQPDELTKSSVKIKNSDSIFDVIRNGANGIYDINQKYFAIASGHISLQKKTIEPWSLITASERNWIDKIQLSSECLIGDLVKVRVGVKTTVDSIFIRSDWKQLPQDIRPEVKLLRPLLSHDDADRWVSKTNSDELRQILYTHESNNGRRTAIDLSKYPKAAAYLEKHRRALESRKYLLISGRNWYEIWVPQDPLSWMKPKLVFPDISPIPKFFFDQSGCVVDGNCYWIVLSPNQNTDLLFLIQGISNSKLITCYHDLAFNNKLYSGRRRYFTQYVEKYPLPKLVSKESKKIIDLVKELVFSTHDKVEQARLEAKLENVVADAYGVDPI